MKRINPNSPLISLFDDKFGNPFVFWEETRRILFIRHGHYVTAIFYVLCPRIEYDPVFLDDEPEILIRDHRGRVVASYIPKKQETIVKRDGREFRFKTPGAMDHYAHKHI